MFIAGNLPDDRTTPAFREGRLWIIFFFYAIVLILTMANHELWGDELHSWNIAKGSGSYLSLLLNTRYEGHPPVWYTLLWLIGKISHNPVSLQLTQGILSMAMIFLLLFFSPLPFFAKGMIPFGYFFLFEYGVLSRNYAVGLLLAFCLCLVLFRGFRGRLLLYYLLLFLLSNTHLLAFLLACSFHLYFLVSFLERKKSVKGLILHVLLGILTLLPALYFISPPSDSQIAPHFWINRWNVKEQLAVVFQAPIRSFIPIPAWWNEHFWNTQFLLEWQKKTKWVENLIPLLSLTIIGLVIFILAGKRRACLFFITNLLLTFAMASIFPLKDARYTGYLYIGFVVAWWLCLSEAETQKTGDNTNLQGLSPFITGKRRTILIILFALQLIGGIYACLKDISLPFSQIFRVKQLLQKIPIKEGEAMVVSDHTSVDDLAAYTDSSFYCLDLQGRKSYILWDRDFATRTGGPHPYSDGIALLFSDSGVQSGTNRIYLVSAWAPDRIVQADSLLPHTYRFNLVEEITGAVEKSSNLYLYRIDRFQDRLLP
ncbi:hypothetical protein ACX0G9_00835 [Flavitalea flava]